MTIGDNRDYIRVLLYSYYTTITGWGVLLSYHQAYSYSQDGTTAGSNGHKPAKHGELHISHSLNS